VLDTLRRCPPGLVAAAAGILLVAGFEGLLALAFYAGGPLTFDVGPSTPTYTARFTESEEHPPLTFRWTRGPAAIEWPFEARGGGARVSLRYGRFIGTPVVAALAFGRGPGARFTARPGRFRIESIELFAPAGASRLELSTDAGDDALGLAVDWVRIEGLRWRLPLRSFWPRLLIAGLFVIGLALGAGWWRTLAALLALGAALAVWAARDPFAFVHVVRVATVPLLATTAVCGWAVRRGPAARFVSLLFVVSFLLKSAAVFYPSHFYPDTRNHSRYTVLLAQGQGGLVERGIQAQRAVGTAYPRHIGGKAYAFPYSPVFFVPFTWLPARRDLLEAALKLVAVILAAAEVPLVYGLGRLLFGPGAGGIGALLAAFLPTLNSRLVLGMYPTVAGHACEVSAVAAALLLARHPASLRRLAVFGGVTLVAFLLYVGSLFNLTAFAAAFALFERRIAGRILLAWAVAAALTVAILYLPFTLTFVGEILPALVRSSAVGSARTEPQTMAGALARIPLFFHWLAPSLGVAGLVLARRRADGPAFRLLCAYGVAFLVLLTMRGLGGGLFKDLKETTFVTSWLAVTAGFALETLWSTGRAGRLATLPLVGGVLAFSLVRYVEYVAAHASLIGPR
jgi:hypothetical protein